MSRHRATERTAGNHTRATHPRSHRGGPALPRSPWPMEETRRRARLTTLANGENEVRQQETRNAVIIPLRVAQQHPEEPAVNCRRLAERPRDHTERRASLWRRARAGE